MFYYQPPKGNCFGHALHPRNPRIAWPKLQAFLSTYFEPTEFKDIELNVNLDAIDARDRAKHLFGQPNYPTLLRWKLKSQEEFDQAVNLILEGYPWSQPDDDPAEPIRLSFSFYLNWKLSVFPKLEWLDIYETDTLSRRISTQVYLGNKSFVTTGFPFPLSSKESGSFDFFQRFSQNAPFKMNPKHFRVIEFGCNGKLTQRKPDNNVAARLQKAILN